MARKGLGKGLASLIPDFYNEDFDSNSTQSLEDMMNETEINDEVKVSEEKEALPKEEYFGDDITSNDKEIPKDQTPGGTSDNTEKNIFEQIEEEKNNQENSIDFSENSLKEDLHANTMESVEPSSVQSNEKSMQTPNEIKIQEHIVEVKEIVDKNPRITLWSSRSSAVFRYLRKTEPEFSISKEASNLIEEAVAKKYPEIWALFDDY